MTKVRKPQTMKTHFCAPFSLTMLAMLIASSETSQRHDTYVHCAQHGQGRFLSHSAQRTHEHQNIYRRSEEVGRSMKAPKRRVGPGNLKLPTSDGRRVGRVHSAPRPTASNCRAQATGGRRLEEARGRERPAGKRTEDGWLHAIPAY
ncbi:unnamed protein product [Prorocentrum cordatum]|uniref:Secreted protein n=1 Tax=Prorocentrum cordatum TaxID=2364126 RepID=A0ABN9X5T3_9DINO|nr:unnamed protein product [Polarella glacialis]